MKNTKLTGEVKDGLFYPTNPHQWGDEQYPSIEWQEFNARYEVLLIFDIYGIPVKDAEKVEAEGPVWQSRESERLPWVETDKSDIELAKSCGYYTRQVYLLTVSPTEQPLKARITTQEYQDLPAGKQAAYMKYCGHDEVYYNLNPMTTIVKADAQPVKEGEKLFSESEFKKRFGFQQSDFDFRAPALFVKSLGLKTGFKKDEADALLEVLEMWLLGSASHQPVNPTYKEFKTAEEILTLYGIEITQNRVDAMQFYAAQFATVAGGGKPDTKQFKKDFEKFLAHPWKDLYQDTMLLSSMREAAEWGFNYANKVNATPTTHSSNEMVEGWISVDERLPKPHYKVLTYNGHIGSNWHNGKEWVMFGGVTHWMRLPLTPQL